MKEMMVKNQKKIVPRCLLSILVSLIAVASLSCNRVSASSSKPQGDWHSQSGYITIEKPNYSFWRSFAFSKSVNAKGYNHKTLIVNGKYFHDNGSTYYSVYKENGQWVGYVNSNAGSISKGKQGKWLKNGNYYQINTSNYNLWRSFGFTSNTKTTNLHNRTFKANGQYNHLNGQTYYSLYDNSGKWLGYINSHGVKPAKNAQGNWLKNGNYYQITNTSYNFWRSFNFSNSVHTKNIANQSFMAEGQYSHFNGQTYYTMYDVNHNWLGYINAHAVKKLDFPKHNEFFLSAHRGDHIDAPENSVEAIDEAKTAGYGMVEIDIQSTKDNQRVLMHDNTVDRTTNGTGSLKQFSYSQLRSFNMDTQAYPKYKNRVVKVPTAKQAFASIKKDNLLVNIDGSKGNWNDSRFVNDLVSTLNNDGIFNNALFMLSNQTIRNNFLAKYPNACVSWLFDPNTETAEHAISQLQHQRKGVLTISSKYVTPKIISLAKNSGIYVHVYSVSDPNVAKKLHSEGVNYVETDNIKPYQVK